MSPVRTAPPLPFMRNQRHRTDLAVPSPEPRFSSGTAAGFFPGLGSRSFYHDLGGALLDSQFPEVSELYREGADALGRRPEHLLLTTENIPESRIERQGFVGAAFLLHNLALHRHLLATARRRGVQLSFQTYTGESFGLLASAVASGSLEVGDGLRIAQAFTPLMLLAAEGDAAPRDRLAERLSVYLPTHLREGGLLEEPSHVVALKGDPRELAEATDLIESVYSRADVEIHKTYSARQTNLYVRSGARSRFDLLVQRFPGLTVAELKPPTRFLAHSRRMKEVRTALAGFLDGNDIVFARPRTPVTSNNDSGLLVTAEQVRDGVLAITDEVMASRSTAETLNALRPDMILELGLGSKSLELLAENDVDAPMAAYTGNPDDTWPLLRTVELMATVTAELESLGPSTDQLEPRHYTTLREMFRMVRSSPFSERYLRRKMGHLVTQAMLDPSRDRPEAYYRLLEIFQHTFSYRDSVDHDAGELVLRARLTKRTNGAPDALGKVDAELLVIDRAGVVTDRTVAEVPQPEAVVFRFDVEFGPDAAEFSSQARSLLGHEPVARQIHGELCRSLTARASFPGPLTQVHRLAVSHLAYRCALFQTLRIHRPALFAQSDHYLQGGDPIGWLVALAVSGAAPLEPLLRLCVAHLTAAGPSATMRAALDDLLSCLTAAEIPVISPDGVPLQREDDLATATRGIFLDHSLDTPITPIHLNGNCQILALGSALAGSQVDVGPHRADVIQVVSAAEIRDRGKNAPLDAFEDHCVYTLTTENDAVLKYARSRNLLTSTVNSYVRIGERIIGFGQGGSESMTVFLTKGDNDTVVVRKVLSEGLTSARWDARGRGVMLPPFTKAKKQAEFLQALPDTVSGYFPRVYETLERDAPIPPHLRKGGKSSYREFMYEMGHVAGDGVSGFIERHSPPPQVIARLYEEILRLLHLRVHSVDRRPAPGRTLEASYFKKIEDRLALCLRTAPSTFGPHLTSTDHIVVNGDRYLNSSALLREFRKHPEYLAALEPPFHSLVMGDTNTENIKIANPAPLLRVQRLIEAGAAEAEVGAALEAVTHDSLGLKFLDPRAIGFSGVGRYTRDDPMYDYKIWHNSIGHYDEIHSEQFALQVRAGAGRTPDVEIEFREGNPYQKAYRVRDVVARRGSVTGGSGPLGMEDYFRPVMTSVHSLDDPGSTFATEDPNWLVRFVFVMGTHFAAMPPFHFMSELDGGLVDTYQRQRRPVAIYCEGIKWLNWALEMLEGRRTEFLGIPVPAQAFRAA